MQPQPQQIRWDDLKYLLALARGGSLLQAARLLRADKTTVARRLAALEQALGGALTERGANGRLRLTALGRTAAAHARSVDDAVAALAAAQPRAATVRLTAVPIVINRILVPAVPTLLTAAPGLSLDLVAEALDLDLAQRDADIALRLGRPRSGGSAVTTRRIGVLTYGVFASAAAGPDLPWIGYEAAMQYLPQAAAIAANAARPGEHAGRLAFNDAEGLYQAVRAGHGKSLLPHRIAAADPLLRPCPTEGAGGAAREVWLMINRAQRDRPEVARVADWLESLFAGQGSA